MTLLITYACREWQDHGGVHGCRDIGAQYIDIFALSRMKDLEGKVFQGGIELMINILPALQEDRIIAAEAEPLGKMMQTKKEARCGKIPAIIKPIQARIEFAYVYLVGKGVIGQNDRKGDNRLGLPGSDEIFNHAALQTV